MSDLHARIRYYPFRYGAIFLFLVLSGCSILPKVNSRTAFPDLGANTSTFGIRQVWVAQAGAVMDSFFEVNTLDNLVTIASPDGTIVAVDAATGKDVWRMSLNEPLAAGVGSDGRLAVVVSRANILVGIVAGRVVWREPLSVQVFGPPLVAGGRVFVLAADRSVSAYDASSGQRLWMQRRPGESLVLRHSGVLLAVGDALVAGGSGRLVGLNPNNGSIRWDVPIATARGTNDVERLIELVGRASRVGESVCVRAFQSAVGCVDTARGIVNWTLAANGADGIDGDNNVVFGVEGNGVVVAWSRSTGERLWESDHLRYRKLTAPLVLGRFVVIGDSTGLLHFLSKVDGVPLNRVETDASGLLTVPVVAGDTLVAVTRNGRVYGFRPD